MPRLIDHCGSLYLLPASPLASSVIADRVLTLDNSAYKTATILKSIFLLLYLWHGIHVDLYHYLLHI